MVGVDLEHITDHRARLKRISLLSGLVLTVAVLGFFFTDWRWFAIDAAILLLFAMAVAIPGIRHRLWRGSPIVPWSTLALLTGLFVLHSYYIELLRQRSERFDVLGVRLPVPTSGGFSVGADDSVDVRLERASDSLTRWRVKLRRTDSSFLVESMPGVEAIEQQVRSTSKLDKISVGAQSVFGIPLKRWKHQAGVTLRPGSAPAVLRTQSPVVPAEEIWIDVRNDKPIVHWDQDSSFLQVESLGKGGNDVYNARMLRKLRTGVAFSELQWQKAHDSQVAESLLLFLTDAPVFSLGPVHFRNYEFQLVPRSNAFTLLRVSASGTTPPIRLEANDSIRVTAGGYRWVFATGVTRQAGYDSGDINVSFGRGPNPRLGWFPAAGICNPISRCTLISNRRLPPAIPYFDLSSFGLDTGRFGLLARVGLERNGVVVKTPFGGYRADGENEVVVPAIGRRSFFEGSYRMRVYRIAKSGLWLLLSTLVGIGVFGFGLARLPSTKQRIGSLLELDTIAANTVWAVASAACVLMGIRLALGYRISYAAPYEPSGADTAVGLCVSAITLTFSLINWTSWGRPAVRQLLHLERANIISAQTTLATVPDTAHSSTRNRAASFVRGAWIPALGVLLIGIGRFGALPRTVVIVTLVLLCWVLVEYLSTQENETSIAYSIGDVIGLEASDSDWGRWTALAVLTLGIPVSVFAKKLSVMLPALIISVSLLWLLARWARRTWDEKSPRLVRDAADSPVSTQRWGALVVVAGFLLGFNALLLLKGGPALLFVGLFFLFLLAIRIGHHSAHAVSSRKNPRALGAVAILVFASIAVLPIDFGLMLVVAVPLVVTFLMTFRVERIRWWVAALSILFLVAIGRWAIAPVLFPDSSGLTSKLSPVETSAAFAKLGGPLRKLGFAELPVRRSVVRALAAQNPDALETVLVRSEPSLAREQIIPALEQIWGGKAYAASGPFGIGLANQTAIGRGIATAVSYAENTFSVYILAEHGFMGATVVVLCYLMLIVIAIVFVWAISTSEPDTPVPNSTAAAVVVGGILMLTIPAFYVAAANIGLMPLTGQNMPFLGLNAWSDVAFVSALLSASIAILVDRSTLEARS